MAKASRKIALKQTKCPVALLGRSLTATIQQSHDLTEMVRDKLDALRKEKPRELFSELLLEAEGSVGFDPREQALSTRLTDTENFASHVTAGSIEGALVQIALAIQTMGGREDCAEKPEEKEEAGRVVRNLVSAFHAIEKAHGFNPNSLNSQHYVSYFE
jgi:hypothetical protein